MNFDSDNKLAFHLLSHLPAFIAGKIAFESNIAIPEYTSSMLEYAILCT